jgi:hypothetical protein
VEAAAVRRVAEAVTAARRVAKAERRAAKAERLAAKAERLAAKAKRRAAAGRAACRVAHWSGSSVGLWPHAVSRRRLREHPARLQRRRTQCTAEGMECGKARRRAPA